MISTWPVSGDINLDQLVKVVSLVVPQCRVTIIPFPYSSEASY